GPLLMDVTDELTGGRTDAPTAMLNGLTQVPTIRALPRTTTALPRTTTALALTTVLLHITVAPPPGFTWTLGCEWASVRLRCPAFRKLAGSYIRFCQTPWQYS